ncbi:MAG: hypothetical protein ABIR28_02880 [Vicinamibacteria bacterium]
MRKVLAVALLDCRRFGLGLVSVALVAGLVPSLASGLGAKVPVANVLFFLFAMVGLVLGGYFGNDFADGRGSFFFARPLATRALIGGRFGALLVISAAVFVATMASYWLSSRDLGRTLSGLTRWHAAVLATTWAVSLYFGLRIASQSQKQGDGVPLSDRLRRLPGVAVMVAATLLTFGLFADLFVRAYVTPGPLRLFTAALVLAAFIASCVAIAAGRTERSRIARFMNLASTGSVALITVVVAASWAYILHPGPEAIRAVLSVTGSPDGRFAFVQATVDRGDPKQFSPLFVLDIASGQARHFNSDPDQGPWASADGSTLAWSEATPFFFRPLWRFLGGARSFRIRTSSGDVEALPMPKRLPGDFGRGQILGATVDWVMPSPEGDVFAIRWDRHLTFMSRSRGELSNARLDPRRSDVLAAAFLSTGELRAAIVRQVAPVFILEFTDIDPGSGTLKTLWSMEVASTVQVHFDAKAGRALLTSPVSPTLPGWRSVSLVDLSQTGAAVLPIVLLPNGLQPAGVFLADGRIAAMGGGRDRRPLRIFSATGAPLLDIPVPEGVASLLPGEMFPRILAIRCVERNAPELLLVDSEDGAIVRRLPGSYWPVYYRNGGGPPPGSSAARLLHSREGLYELPSLTAEPRLLLPLGVR